MKSARFRYYDPASIDDALSLLSVWGEEARVLSGGQTLGPMLNLRLATPGAIIDINGVKELSYRNVSDDGIAIGALTRQAELEDSREFASLQPLAAAAIPLVAHRAIRNRGTIGGTLANADPAAEWGGLALALDATLTILRQGNQTRKVVASDFFVGMLETAIAPGELLVEISLPHWPKGAGYSIQEFSRRHGDFAIAGIACVVEVDEDGRILDARIATFGVEPVPRRLIAAEDLLKCEQPTASIVKAAALRAAADVSPMNDRHGSPEYRRHLVNVLAERALKAALNIRTAAQ